MVISWGKAVILGMERDDNRLLGWIYNLLFTGEVKLRSVWVCHKFCHSFIKFDRLDDMVSQLILIWIYTSIRFDYIIAFKLKKSLWFLVLWVLSVWRCYYLKFKLNRSSNKYFLVKILIIIIIFNNVLLFKTNWFQCGTNNLVWKAMFFF